LSKLRCFGTDGEEALSEKACPKPVHYFRQNIKDKLRGLHVAKDKQKSYFLVYLVHSKLKD